MKKILYTILIFLFLIMITLLYSRFIGTKGLIVKENIVYSDITNSFDGLKIIHFSDIHYGHLMDKKKVREIVTKINKTKPDLVLFCGDMLDTLYELNHSDINFLVEELGKIEAKYGKFSILGDNDYKQKDSLINIYIQSGFTLLDNRSSIVYNENNDKIVISGLGSYNHGDSNLNEIDSKIDINSIPYRIILVHEPDYILKITNSAYNFQLILAGHSINGSINIPGLKKILMPSGAKKYYKSYNHINNTDIFITNGVGVNQFNFRLFNPPSINLYRMKSK